MVILYEETGDKVQERLVAELRKSPYRNYMKGDISEGISVAYFMMLYPCDCIEQFYRVLEEKGMTYQYKVKKYPSNDYPGYAYIKIYHREATKEHMIERLKEMLNIKETMSFGSIPGHYDEVIEGNLNSTVHILYVVVKRFCNACG